MEFTWEIEQAIHYYGQLDNRDLSPMNALVRLMPVLSRSEFLKAIEIECCFWVSHFAYDQEDIKS